MQINSDVRQGHGPLRVIKRVAVGIMLAVGLVGGATPALAFTSGGSGYHGSITVPKAYAWLENYDIDAYLGTASRTVTESQAYAARDQYVCVTTQLWALENQNFPGTKWVNTGVRHKKCAWIPAAQTRVSIPGALFKIARVAYGLDVIVTWQLSNGTQVGSQWVDYGASDLQVLNANGSVGTFQGSGWIRIN